MNYVRERKREGERLRGQGDKIKFIDLTMERGQFPGKEEEGKACHELNVFWMNDDLWMIDE